MGRRFGFGFDLGEWWVGAARRACHETSCVPVRLAEGRAGGGSVTMLKLNLVAGVCAALVWAGTALGQELYKATPGPCRVKQRDADWRDVKRDRDVPVRVYVPEAPEKSEKEARGGAGEQPMPPYPVIVFSHGMGANRMSYRYVCEHLATQGYLVVVPTHEGSDTKAIVEEGKQHRRDKAEGKRDVPVVVENTSDPKNLENRPLDVSFVLDHLGVDKDLAKLADLSRVGVAGHSFGANTVMEIAGMTVDLPRHPGASFRDARVKAVVAMSPQGAGAMGVRVKSWDSVAAPVLFLTGTKDYGQGERSATWRREAFDAIKSVDEYLVVLNGATHMTFGRGPGLGLDKEQARYTALIDATTTAFFDAYVKGDAEAKRWLTVFSMAKHGECTVEFRPGGK